VGGPKLDTVFQACPSKCWIELSNHIPWPAAVQDVLCLHCLQGALLTHVDLAICQDLQVLYSRAILCPCNMSNLYSWSLTQPSSVTTGISSFFSSSCIGSWLLQREVLGRSYFNCECLLEGGWDRMCTDTHPPHPISPQCLDSNGRELMFYYLYAYRSNLLFDQKDTVRAQTVSALHKNA